MKTWLRIVSCTFALLAPGVVPHATADLGSPRIHPLFAIPEGRVVPAVFDKLARAEQDCTFPMASRHTNVEEYARCDAAIIATTEVPGAVGLSALAYRDAELAKPDRARLDVALVYRVVAHAGQLEVLDPLVTALERLERGATFAERSEASLIHWTLGELTYTKPTDHSASAWRRWLAAHANETRAQLLAAHLDRLRATITNPKPRRDELFAAFETLIKEPTTRDEAIRALSDPKLPARVRDDDAIVWLKGLPRRYPLSRVSVATPRAY